MLIHVSGEPTRGHDFTRWILEKVDSFPKNQRFIFNTRLADYALDVIETLVKASHSRRKSELLARANRKIEMLRWLVRLEQDRKLLTQQQYLFACSGPRTAVNSSSPGLAAVASPAKTEELCLAVGVNSNDRTSGQRLDSPTDRSGGTFGDQRGAKLVTNDELP